MNCGQSRLPRRRPPCKPKPPCECPPGGEDWIGSLKGQLTIPIYAHMVVDPYEGPYTIIPKAFDNQSLHTKNKTCSDDILVEKVPYYETTNNSNGLTAYIAEEV